MEVNVDDIIHCETSKGSMKRHKRGVEASIEDQTLGELFDEDFDTELQCSSLRDYSQFGSKDVNTSVDSRFVEVINEDGSTKTVLKSSLIWILTETKDVLSNDRLKRVQSHDSASIKRKNRTEFDLPSKRKNVQIGIFQNIELQVGDWCFFFLKISLSVHCMR